MNTAVRFRPSPLSIASRKSLFHWDGRSDFHPYANGQGDYTGNVMYGSLSRSGDTLYF